MIKLPTIVETYIRYSVPNRITSDLLIDMLTWYINGGGGSGGGGANPQGPTNSVQLKASNTSFNGVDDFKFDPVTKEMTLGGVIYKNQLTSLFINNDQSTPINLIALPIVSKFYTINYSVERGDQSRVGTIQICHNGTISKLTDMYSDTEGSNIDDSAIKFSTVINAGVLYLQYTSNDVGLNGIFKYNLIRW